ncbi:hypothetical protein X975_22405, partial [Stegodyphus mimosarum]
MICIFFQSFSKRFNYLIECCLPKTLFRISFSTVLWISKDNILVS